MFTDIEQQFLLATARKAVEHYLATGLKLHISEVVVPPALCEPRACFVTLTKNFDLRGCIGSLEAHQPLYLDVVENATAAAFADDRFFPLTKEEYPEVSVEVSVLTKPQPVAFTSPQELMDKLTVGRDGVIIKKGNESATYLPQVWDEMLEKHNFLSSLCLKAGLPPDEWQKPGVTVLTYQVELVEDKS